MPAEFYLSLILAVMTRLAAAVNLGLLSPFRLTCITFPKVTVVSKSNPLLFLYLFNQLKHNLSLFYVRALWQKIYKKHLLCS